MPADLKPVDYIFVFPRLKTMSGAETFLASLTAFLAERGNTVEVRTRAVDHRCRRALHPRVEVTQLENGSLVTGHHLFDCLLDVLLSPLLVRRIEKPRAVVCFMSDPVLPAMWWYRLFGRSCTTVVYHCLQPPRFVYDLLWQTATGFKPLSLMIPVIAWPYRWMDRFASRSCDAIISISEAYADWCRRLYGPRTVEMVHPGIEAPEEPSCAPRELRESYGFSADHELVVTVNKLIPRKNVDLFIRSFQRLVAIRPRARALIVGDGPCSEELQDLATQLGLDRFVRFTGFLGHRREVFDCYRAADLHVFLERNVPFGLTVIEAASCGLPTIAFASGGALDTVVHQETGVLIDASSRAVQVADQMASLLGSPGRRQRMGEQARRFAAGFEMATQGRNFEAAIDRIRSGQERRASSG